MKKKIVALCLVVCLLAIAIVGGTLAYFTDTHAQTNTFTAGNVDITLNEAVIKKVDTPTAPDYGDLVAVGSGERTSEDQIYGKLYPGQTICKDPTITNVGSEDAYVAAKIVVTDGAGDIYPLIGSGHKGLLRIDKIARGGIIKDNDTQKADYNGLTANGLPVYGDDTYSVYQVGDMANGTYTFYVFFENALVKDAEVVLFEELFINADWDNDQMKELKELKIDVQAYATQEYGFKDCFTAMTTAFPNEFDFSFVTTP